MEEKKCQHENIHVFEELYWKGYKEEGQYDLKNKGGEITKVICDDCGTELTEEEIDYSGFNFN